MTVFLLPPSIEFPEQIVAVTLTIKSTLEFRTRQDPSIVVKFAFIFSVFLIYRAIVASLTRMWISLIKHVGPYNSTIFITQLKYGVYNWIFFHSKFLYFIFKSVSQLKTSNILDFFHYCHPSINSKEKTNKHNHSLITYPVRITVLVCRMDFPTSLLTTYMPQTLNMNFKL